MEAIPADISGYLDEGLLEWLLSGDVSIRYQAHRDLLDSSPAKVARLRSRIPKEGWGKAFLDRRREDGWWQGWYSPKWTSTHYSLLELADIGMDLSDAETREVCRDYVEGMWAGGAYDKKKKRWFDVCVAGMLLSIAAKSGLRCGGRTIEGMVDYLLERRMPDGGWNCAWWRDSSCRKGSVHTTISVLEALRDLDGRGREGLPSYPRGGGAPELRAYRRAERLEAEDGAAALLLKRRVFLRLSSDEPIRPGFGKASFPPRWHFDYLRALDWFASVGRARARGMDHALALLLGSRRPDGAWPVGPRHAGKFHFHMESGTAAGRWNTLRALRVIRNLGGAGRGNPL